MIRHTLFFTIGMAVLAAGCNTLPGGPAIHTNMDDPLVLTPGEVRIITVRVDDRHGLVSRVIATVVSGETDKHVTLLDDGVTEPEGSRADDVAGGDRIELYAEIGKQQFHGAQLHARFRDPHLRPDDADKPELTGGELACTSCGRGWCAE